MINENYLTPEGLKKIKEELNHLRSVSRGEVAAKIKEARDMGDVLENTQYDSAIEEKSYVEGRIKELEDALSKSKVVKSKSVGKNSIVQVGTKVVVESGGAKDIFTIVGSIESDPVNKLISNESPVGAALIGAKLGEVVEVKTPVFTVKYKILELK